MLFNSLSFFIFFPIVTAIYFLIPHRFRWSWLLLASSYFYMNFVPVYILILAFTIAIDYCAGLVIQKTEDKKRKKLFLLVSVLANIGVLAFFKYANFGIGNINALASFTHWNYSINLLKIVLPIGLSFHTFQSLSYVIEVYRGNQAAEKNLGIFALYVMFYPQLVAGPIERPQNLLHQFKEEHRFDYDKAVSGLKLMTWGFFKKIVIADHLAEFVNPVYNNVTSYHGLPLIMATVFFAFQIYYDFSGYTDIARGAARVMGFELMINFNNPYRSKSIAEFWKRWHISLSSWFRDYVYIPLGGNRVAKVRYACNVLVVFLLSGLWHGSNWTYVAWGGLNGFYLVCSGATSAFQTKLRSVMRVDRWEKIHSFLATCSTFMLICFTWIFFRANNMNEAWYIFRNLFTGLSVFTDLTSYGIFNQQIMLGRGMANFAVVVVSILFVESVSYFAENKIVAVEKVLDTKQWYYRWAAYYGVIVAIFALGVFSPSSFIYFQF